MEEKKRLNLHPSHISKIRIIFIIGFLFDEYLYLQVCKNNIFNYLTRKTTTFTNWCHFITFLYFILATFFFKDNKKTKNNYLSILFHLAISCQFLVTTVYWLLLHKEAIKMIKCPYLIKYCYTAHIFPFLYLLFDFFFNNIILPTKKTIYAIIIFTTCYLFNLAYLELNYNLQIYQGINFKNLYTIYFGIGCYFMVFMGWFLSFKLERFKYVTKVIDSKEKVD